MAPYSTVVRDAPQGTMLVCETGSHAYGLSTPDSDYDYAGVYVIPLRRYLSYCGHGADTVVRHNKPDATFHDVAKFCRLATQGNPNVLEVVWGARPVYSTELGAELLELRRAFLHRGSLKPYFGYYEAQTRRLKNGFGLHTKGGQWNPKFAAHLLRLMYAAKHLADTCEVMVELPAAARGVVMEAREGRMGVERVLALGNALKRQAQKAEETTALPHLPDRKRIDAFVYKARMQSAEG